jgi:hypothetical protein
MRCIEVYNAERVMMLKALEQEIREIEVNLIMFEESSEFY